MVLGLRAGRAMWEQQEGPHTKPRTRVWLFPTKGTWKFLSWILQDGPAYSSLSPPLNAPVTDVAAINSPPPSDFTFYYPLHCFTQVYVFHYVLCCHFSYFIFESYSNSAAGSCVAIFPPPSSCSPSVLLEPGVFYWLPILKTLARRWCSVMQCHHWGWGGAGIWFLHWFCQSVPVTFGSIQLAFELILSQMKKWKWWNQWSPRWQTILIPPYLQNVDTSSSTSYLRRF